jgi:hypothetical protein
MRGGVMPGRHRSTSPRSSAHRRQAVWPGSRWRARLAFVGAGACAGLVGQAIGLGLLEWPPGGLPGFPWWEPPAAYASPGAGPGMLDPRTDGLPVGDAAWLVPWSASGEQQGLLRAGWMPVGPVAFTGPITAAARSALAGPALASASGTPLVPTPQGGGSSVPAVPDVPAALGRPGGDTLQAVSGGVAPVTRSVVGAGGDVVSTATGAVGGVARVSGDVVATAGDAVTTTTRTLGGAGRVPSAVVDTAGAAATTIRDVDDTVADSVEQVHVPQAKVHVSEQAAADGSSAPIRPQRVVDKVDGIVHATAEAVPSTQVDNAVRAATEHPHTTGDVSATKKASSRKAGDTDSSSDGSSSGAVDHTVHDVATSAAHLRR